MAERLDIIRAELIRVLYIADLPRGIFSSILYIFDSDGLILFDGIVKIFSDCHTTSIVKHRLKGHCVDSQTLCLKLEAIV